jgi:hypothetical protein
MLLAGTSGNWIRLNIPKSGGLKAVRKRMVEAGELEPYRPTERLTKSQDAEVQRLLLRGASMRGTARLVGCGYRSVRKRAVRLGLIGPDQVPPPRAPGEIPYRGVLKLRPDDEALAFRLLIDGTGDKKIGDAIRLSRDVIKRWRWRLGIRGEKIGGRCKPYPALMPQVRHEMLDRLRAGECPSAVAEDERHTLCGLLVKNSPRSNRVLYPDRDNGPHHGAPLPPPHQLFSIVKAAISRGVPYDVRSDAEQDLFIAISTGWLKLADLKSQVSSYVSRAWRNNTSQFSLDEPIGENGFSRLNLLADPSAEQEMEDALERAWR